MNLEKELLENKVTVEANKDTVINNLKFTDNILAWNEKEGFEISTIKDCIANITNELYVVKANGLTVSISADQGFWLDGGEEIKATDLVAGETKVYVKEDEGIVLTTIDSIEILKGQFIVYDVIGSTYRNYILNGFILHNWDPDDYKSSFVIGPDHIEVGDIAWDDMYTTARATRDAHLKSLNELILASIARGVQWDDTALKADILDILQNDLEPAIENMFIKQSRFFNSLIPASSQYSGLVTAGNTGSGERVTWPGWIEQIESPQFSWALPDVNFVQFDIDYTGSTAFSETIWTEHKDAMTEFMAASKRVFAKLLNWRVPENNYTGITPINGFYDDFTYDNI